MGSGSWFKSLICLKKVKQDKSKQVHSASESANNGKRHQTANESSSLDNAGALPGKLIQEKAATRIQKAFRAYRMRKSLQRLKGRGRFNMLIRDQTVQKQTSTALNYIHSWSNIQAQIRNRRLCMVTEGRIKQKKLENQLKVDAKLHELEVEWHNSSETMEEILSKIQQREEAAVKRERAMAYAFSHQWRANSNQYLGQAYYSICKDNWGWSWTERWVAARPWEIRANAKLNPKKVKTKQVCNGDKQLTNQAESKVNKTTKTKNQAAQEKQ